MSYVLEVRGSIKCYDWGKLGSDSSVAMLHKPSTPDFQVQVETPYAELWMGTHPSGPSVIPSLDNMTLSEWIKDHPDTLGSRIRTRFQCDGLPFLFKVLSVRKALSIQVHPDLQTAKILHQRSSELYPDDNHKPELAIALTNFQAMCGFRPVSEIKAFILELRDFESLIGPEITTEFLNSEDTDKHLLRKLFCKVITSPPEIFQPRLKNLVHEFSINVSLSDLCKSVKEVFLTVCNEYPDDIGCFCVFFLNLMSLRPGQAIFLAANEPHAYLKGDCIECMACSDNVIRAGLTPKYKDVDTLCEVLSYQCKQAHENIFHSVPETSDSHVKIYNPPVPEFAVAKIEVEEQMPHYQLSAVDSASLLIVVEGEAEASFTREDTVHSISVHYGSILYISCLTTVDLNIKSAKITMYRAYCA